MVNRLMTMIGSWATLASLAWDFHPPGRSLAWWEGALIGISLLLLALLIWLEFKEYSRLKRFRSQDKASINNYMLRWISRGDRVAIFTRDMTWAHDQRLKDLLGIKAEKDELSIFLPKSIPLVEQLREKGATVYTYPGLAIDPASRFTIINYGKGDAQVAIGRTFQDKHVIEEFAAGTHPVFHVVMDLVEVLKGIKKLQAAEA